MWNPLRAREDEESPNWRQVCILFLGGLVVAFGSCSGWFSVGLREGRTSKIEDKLGGVYAVAFVISAFALLLGFCLGLVLLFRSFSSDR